MNSNKREDATPIQEDVMTERQKQHSKIYEGSGRRNLRNTGKSLDVGIPPSFIEPDDEKSPPTIGELLQRVSCNADVVVVGTVTNKTSQLTEDGSFVFSDYDMRVEEVIKKQCASINSTKRQYCYHPSRRDSPIQWQNYKGHR